MKEMSIREIQLVELNILKNIANFCDKNNIKYFLGCGTLCGAVVRCGFFPWDNDIDILMPREDYEKFIKLYKNNDDIRLLTCFDKGYYYPYAKAISNKTVAYECKVNIPNYGVFIDIFPIDGVPNNLYLHLLKPIKYLMMSQWGCYLDNRNIFVKIIYKLVSLITFIFPKNFFARILNSICKKYSYKKYKRCGIVVHYRKKNEIINSHIFKKRERITFEGERFYAPYKSDEYLKCLYGDYFTEDDHMYNKHFRAYWKKG